MDRKSILALYDNDISDNWGQEVNRIDWDRVETVLLTRLSVGSRVLDIGCNTGGLLMRLKNKFHVNGLEVNSSAARKAKYRTKSTIWKNLESIPEDLKFDAIISCDVIEHVHDPAVFIHSICRHLKHNGIVVITTGDADNWLWRIVGANWWYCSFPEHISFISEKWLKKFTTDSRIKIICCEKFRYHNYGILRRFLDFQLAFFFGFFPKTYQRSVHFLQMLFRRNGSATVRGVGLAKDHLLIAIQPIR